MNQTPSFALKQVVWAQVPQYPWWPSRIVGIQKSNSQNIYRVNFFGDPTYCLLQQSDLMIFEAGLFQLSEQYINHYNLHQPLQLAKAALKKNNNDSAMQEEHNKSIEKQQLNIAEVEDQYRVETKQLIENIEKLSLETRQTNIKYQKNPQQISLPEYINTNNVLDVLASKNSGQLRKRKTQQNRKNMLTLNQTLKQKLLEKYNLHKYTQQITEQLRPCFTKRIKKKQRVTISKQRKQQDLKKLFTRKMREIIRIHIKGYIAMQYAVRICNLIEQMSQIYVCSQWKLFKAVAVWLNNTKGENISCYQAFLEGLFSERKEEIDEKSKCTLIPTENQNILNT